MKLIHKLLNFVLPPITVFAICLILPFLSIFKFFDYIFRYLFPENLKGKVVLITGASSGIGEHLAYEYAKKGANLALVARREDTLREVANKSAQLGSPDVLVIRADVSQVDQCKQFIEVVVNHFGRLDHLVCNAGIGFHCAFEDASNVTNFVPDVNFWGSIYPTYFAIPYLKRFKGKIVVNASVAGWMIQPRVTIYGASKAALINFYDNLRVELARKVSITIVSPGFVDSELSRGKLLTMRGEVEVDPMIRKILRGIPFESTRECAKAIVAAASRGDKYITEPWWYNVLYLLRILCPDMLEWSYHLLLSTCEIPLERD
ncbi:11-beta-hydroxysteroid dehydrogenase A-like isoform X2 [Telopea speciosissima]|uniref:11-beta-hydroxysteroid dehydrogenase A-like isoform X2 n=1 Tax=Telopea speciosissima TaxID=54955 RepID=UPI001CC4717B|nr:11-beta-hydroxysteroid dehydrogenase A-like isoform X2 [Telopea speciosissima]